MTFAEAVKSLRIKAGLTQAELASRVDVVTSAINQYERGKRLPSPEIVVRLGMALGLPPVESIAFLAVAGYADELWREQASNDLSRYISHSAHAEPITQN